MYFLNILHQLRFATLASDVPFDGVIVFKSIGILCKVLRERLTGVPCTTKDATPRHAFFLGGTPP